MKRIIKTLELCKKLFNIKEISCESDPNHIDPNKLSMFKGIIDRLSCGIQSFDDETLKKWQDIINLVHLKNFKKKFQKL